METTLRKEETNFITLLENTDWNGSLITKNGNLPLQSVQLETKLEGIIHETTITQTFYNTFSEPLDCTYIFPLPFKSSVTKVVAFMGKSKLKAKLLERKEARQQYEVAINKGKTAVLLEEERSDVFTLSLGNLEPNEWAKISIVIFGPLELDDGIATWRMPLVCAPRYTPGKSLYGVSTGFGTSSDTEEVPDASRLNPPIFKNTADKNVLFTAKCILGKSIESITSNFTLEKNTTDKGTYNITPGSKMNKDLIISYPVLQTQLNIEAYLKPDSSKSEKGTIALVLKPGEDKKVTAKNIVFVLDKSGSMQGWKMQAAQKAADRLIESLTTKDSFSLIAFSNNVEKPFVKNVLKTATDENKYAATSWLNALQAGGGTNALEPLLEAANLLQEEKEKENYIVFVTDGQTTAEDHIIKAMHEHLKNTRIYTIGIDKAVNAGFLDRLAKISGGKCEIATSMLEVNATLEKIQHKINSPIFTNVKAFYELNGVKKELEAASSWSKNCFSNTPLLLLARYEGPAPFQVTLETTEGSFKVEPVLSLTKAWKLSWAREKILDLEDQYTINPQEETSSKIVETSLKYKTLSKFTAFLAVGKECGQKATKHILQPVEKIEGWVYTPAFTRSTAVSSFTAATSYRSFNSANINQNTIGATNEVNTVYSSGLTNSHAPKADFFANPSIETAPIAVFSVEIIANKNLNNESVIRKQVNIEEDGMFFKAYKKRIEKYASNLQAELEKDPALKNYSNMLKQLDVLLDDLPKVIELKEITLLLEGLKSTLKVNNTLKLKENILKLLLEIKKI